MRRWSGEETAYINGRIYTSDPEMPEAEAFVIRNGKFIAAGANDIVTDCPHIVDLQGQCVIPGLVDSHCHILAGVEKNILNLYNIDPKTKPEELGDVLLSLLREQGEDREETGHGPECEKPAGCEEPAGCEDVSGEEEASGNAGKGILRAMGMDLTQGTFSADDIDRVIDDREVVVFSDDGHALLLNRRAMETLGIDSDTKDPGEHSYFVRDEDGNPTGLVIEIPAMMLCKALMKETKSDVKIVLKELCREYASYGYTAVFDAMSVDSEDDAVLSQLSELDKEGALCLHICTSFGYRGEDGIKAAEVLKLMKHQREFYSTEHVHPNTLKMIADGTIEEHTALLFEPYADEPQNCGSEMISFSDMKKAAVMAAKEGFCIHIHAIGDGAVQRALSVLRAVDYDHVRKTIAHNQLYGKQEMRELAEAGDIFFQTTPHWVKNDAFTRRVLGEDRFNRQFPMATANRNGVAVTFGSDSCLEPITANAFLGMYFAEARGQKACEGLCYPPLTEGLDREICLKAYTINGAEQLGISDVTGSITPGKSADFVIVDRDLMKCSLEELQDTRVLETYFAGREVFRAEKKNEDMKP